MRVLPPDRGRDGPARGIGSHRARSLYQLDGSKWARIGITNSSPITEVMAAAVCRMIAPAANANSPHRVTYNAVPITARSTLGPDSDALSCVLASSDWPRKNAMKAATNVTTRATTAKTTTLAAYTVMRRGIAVSEVLIIPVEWRRARWPRAPR